MYTKQETLQKVGRFYLRAIPCSYQKKQRNFDKFFCFRFDLIFRFLSKVKLKLRYGEQAESGRRDRLYVYHILKRNLQFIRKIIPNAWVCSTGKFFFYTKRTLTERPSLLKAYSTNKIGMKLFIIVTKLFVFSLMNR